ncbi:ZFP36L1 [Symbiodinium sp. CCMP2592]|nr:ZFP36L1 [Symbiodinium sp. CCMP2592]
MRQSLFHGTTLCKFFEKGKCSRGNNCNFAHGRRRLRDKPNLAKTKWCAAFLESGSCFLGEECPYAHDTDEKRKYRGKHVVSVDQAAEPYISDTSDVLAESIPTEQPHSSVAAGSSLTDASASTRHMPDFEESAESDAYGEVAPPSRRSVSDEEASQVSDVPYGGPVLDVSVRNTFLHFQEQSESSGLRRSASWTEGVSGTGAQQWSSRSGSDQEAALQLSSLEVRSFAG